MPTDKEKKGDGTKYTIKTSGPSGEPKTVKREIKLIKKKPDLTIDKTIVTKGAKTKTPTKRPVSIKKKSSGTPKPSTGGRPTVKKTPDKVRRVKYTLKSPAPKGLTITETRRPNIEVKKVSPSSTPPPAPPKKPTSKKRLKISSKPKRKRPNKMIRLRSKKTKIC